jgi:alanine racemase
MDLMAIAIPEDDTIKIGDEVELWGPNLPIETIAATLDRSALDILMPLAGRVQRHYIFTLGN